MVPAARPRLKTRLLRISMRGDDIATPAPLLENLAEDGMVVAMSISRRAIKGRVPTKTDATADRNSR